jgi:hypothetical protein
MASFLENKKPTSASCYCGGEKLKQFSNQRRVLRRKINRKQRYFDNDTIFGFDDSDSISFDIGINIKIDYIDCNRNFDGHKEDI